MFEVDLVGQHVQTVCGSPQTPLKKCALLSCRRNTGNFVNSHLCQILKYEGLLAKSANVGSVKTLRLPDPAVCALIYMQYNEI